MARNAKKTEHLAAEKSRDALINTEADATRPLHTEFAHLAQQARAAAKRSGLKPSELTKAIAKVRRANGT